MIEVSFGQWQLFRNVQRLRGCCQFMRNLVDAEIIVKEQETDYETMLRNDVEAFGYVLCRVDTVLWCQPGFLL